MKPSVFVVAIQYWEGDRDDALELGNLIADLEETKRSNVELLFARRFDARPPDEEYLSKLREKFETVSVFQNQRKVTGWPFGCNALWLELMNFMCEEVKDNGRAIEAVVTFEGDDVPMRRDWLNVVMQEWRTARDQQDVWIMGHYIDHPKMPHINGNLVAHPMLPLWVPKLNSVPHGEAWDTWNWKYLKDHAFDSPYIYSERFLSAIDFPNLCKRKDPKKPLAYRHGIKDVQSKHYVRQILKTFSHVPGDWSLAQRVCEGV